MGVTEGNDNLIIAQNWLRDNLRRRLRHKDLDADSWTEDAAEPSLPGKVLRSFCKAVEKADLIWKLAAALQARPARRERRPPVARLHPAARQNKKRALSG